MLSYFKSGDATVVDSVLKFIKDNGLESQLPSPEPSDDVAFNASKRASVLVDSFEPNFSGVRVDGAEQERAWPRIGALFGGVAGVAIPAQDDAGEPYIPKLILLATARLTIRLLNDQDPFGNWYESEYDANLAAGTVKVEETIHGVITERWQPTSPATSVSTASDFTVRSLLRPLFKTAQLTTGR